MDGPKTGTMSRSHVLVKTLYSIRTGEVSEFFVHIMCTRPGVIPEPDAEVFDLQGFLLVYLEQLTQIQPLALPYRLPLERLQRHMQIHTTLTPMISPFAFLTFFSCLKATSVAVGS